MRYILSAPEGGASHLIAVSFGGEIECSGQSCTEYTGAIPEGYASLGQWYEDNIEELRLWTVNSAGDLELLEGVPEPVPGVVNLASGVWNYSRRPDGRIELWGDIPVTFPDSNLMQSGFYRSIVSLDLSDALATIYTGDCPWQEVGRRPVVCRNGAAPSTAEVVILAPAQFSGFTATLPLYIIGK